MILEFEPVRRQAYGEQITQRLRDAIVRGERPVGQRLVEGQLATEFDVSRGPIRDALRQLERESLVESRGSAGSYVVGIAAGDIDELYSLRGAVEGLAADLAMERDDPDGWVQMAGIVDELEQCADSDDAKAFAEADIRFHSLIYSLSGHRRLADIWQQYAPMLTTLLRTTVLIDADLHESAAKHRRLLELLRSGDHSKVAEELKAHLENSHRRMLEAHRDGSQGGQLRR